MTATYLTSSMLALAYDRCKHGTNQADKLELANDALLNASPSSDIERESVANPSVIRHHKDIA